MRDPVTVALFACLAIVFGGCATPEPAPPPEQWKSAAMPFLQDGVTTREQVLLKLGTPSGRFENDRILTYRVVRDGPTKFALVERRPSVPTTAAQPQEDVTFHLVLVFAPANTLEKHSLVPVR